MGGTSEAEPLAVRVKLCTTADGLPPSHHVLAPAPGTTLSSYLPHWNPQPSTSSHSQNAESIQETQLREDEASQNIACLPNSIALVDPAKVVRTGFRNPWPSWHKPTVTEVWQGLEWGEDPDTAIEYAMQDADLTSSADPGTEDEDRYKDSRPGTPDLEGAPPNGRETDPSHAGPSTSWFAQQTFTASTPYTRQQRIKMASKQLLTIQEPSFEFDSDSKLKATWLGHAGVLVQLPPLTPDSQAIRVLFDPIFSQRCSPTQVAGPTRTYAAPCSISSLPPIDLVIISHNHYDHLDYATVRELWELNSDRIRFIVPLGNKDWFIGPNTGNGQDSQPTPSTASSGSTESLTSTWTFTPSGATTSALSIPPERVTELDWWDEMHLTHSEAEGAKALRVVCTPAQHGSGRYGVDTNCALWSSWFLDHPHPSADDTPTRIFFGGDTGCQFHGPSFPPAPPLSASTLTTPLSETGDIAVLPGQPALPHPTYRGGLRLDPDELSPYPPCPAFAEIVHRLGAPSFLMLPISVGATISFLRSYIPLPDSLSPFPRITPGLTAANHMPPWDAVRVFDEMSTVGAVCMAIHWGTFISGPEEVLKTLGQLKWACGEHGVLFRRQMDGLQDQQEASNGKSFVALNHGASITL